MTAPDVPYRFEIAVEVRGTPELVWRTIATANGMSSWMMPTDLEERVGGEVQFHMGDADSVGRVTAYDAPDRLVVEEPGWAALAGHEGADVSPLATEFLVEATGGGTCVVRVVASAFGTGADWEGEFWEAMSAGWTPCFETLRLVLEHFPGQTVTSLDATAIVDREQSEVLTVMRSSVLDQGVDGELVQETGISLTFRLTAPVPGLLVLMTNSDEDGKTWVSAQGHLFSPDAAAWVESTRKDWQAWLEGLGR